MLRLDIEIALVSLPRLSPLLILRAAARQAGKEIYAAPSHFTEDSVLEVATQSQCCCLLLHAQLDALLYVFGNLLPYISHSLAFAKLRQAAAQDGPVKCDNWRT